VRLQPRFGTVEVRVMDAQTRVRDTASLAALVQALVRREALEPARRRAPIPPEVIEENRFLAARDGAGAALVAPDAGRCVPVATVLEWLLQECEPHARQLGCAPEFAAARQLAVQPGYARQRSAAGRPEGLPGVVAALHGEFVTAREPVVL
jgi:glutamate---cysteine ligase / carboxylate-amine ligase